MPWALDITLHHILPSVLSNEGASRSESRCRLNFPGTWQESLARRARRHGPLRVARATHRRMAYAAHLAQLCRSQRRARDEPRQLDNPQNVPRRRSAAILRDTDEMLDRVSRTETESNDVYRRMEEQMRGVARRLDTAERSQSENNRVMAKAATEINIATREQAQAFDQLGTHVANLAERIDRVEHATHTSGLKEPSKACTPASPVWPISSPTTPRNRRRRYLRWPTTSKRWPTGSPRSATMPRIWPAVSTSVWSRSTTASTLRKRPPPETRRRSNSAWHRSTQRPCQRTRCQGQPDCARTAHRRARWPRPCHRKRFEGRRRRA